MAGNRALAPESLARAWRALLHGAHDRARATDAVRGAAHRDLAPARRIRLGASSSLATVGGNARASRLVQCRLERDLRAAIGHDPASDRARRLAYACAVRLGAGQRSGARAST